VRQIEQARDDVRRFAVQWQHAANELLADLVECDDPADDRQFDRARVGAG
jgi:hypothetical protein